MSHMHITSHRKCEFFGDIYITPVPILSGAHTDACLTFLGICYKALQSLSKTEATKKYKIHHWPILSPALYSLPVQNYVPNTIYFIHPATSFDIANKIHLIS